jgi:hypothetical protein
MITVIESGMMIVAISPNSWAMRIMMIFQSWTGATHLLE